MYNAKLVLTLLFVATIGQLGYGQFNIKVGYIGTAPRLTATNNVFKTYNNSNQPAIPFKKVRYFQGLDIGARYTWKNLSSEIGWTNQQSASTKTDGALGTDNWRITTSEYYLSLCSQWQFIGFGTSVGYNRMRYRQLIEGTRDRKNLVNERFLNARFFLSIEAQGDVNTIAIRPFYQPSFGKWNISGLENAINGASITSLNESYEAFGISVVIYNGPQFKR